VIAAACGCSRRALRLWFAVVAVSTFSAVAMGLSPRSDLEVIPHMGRVAVHIDVLFRRPGACGSTESREGNAGCGA
jgi:hypothetical protein